jgi:hypothetical protein
MKPTPLSRRLHRGAIWFCGARLGEGYVAWAAARLMPAVGQAGQVPGIDFDATVTTRSRLFKRRS